MMKKFILALMALTFSMTTFAQAPNGGIGGVGEQSASAKYEKVKRVHKKVHKKTHKKAHKKAHKKVKHTFVSDVVLK
jgi:hypothetical protein